MPYSVRKASGGGYDIIKTSTGQKVGHSDTKAKAESSINARNAGAHGWKGTKKGK
jgi:hypothetical protein